MADNSSRKTFFILTLAASLMAALIAVVVRVMNDEELRDQLGTTYYVITLAIIGCVLLVLAGYVWDRTLMQKLRTLRSAAGVEDGAAGDGGGEPDHDEIIGLARNIERM